MAKFSHKVKYDGKWYKAGQNVPIKKADDTVKKTN